MTSQSFVSSRQSGSVLHLTIDNPPANTLSESVLDSLHSLLSSCESDNSISVIVISSTGSIFSAGHDLKEMESHRSDSDSGRSYYEHILSKCSSVMQQIVMHPKPIIAEVNGSAFAAGCQLVASCDLAVATSSSTFCTPGVHIGLFCSTPMVALSRNVSRKHAMEMLLLGDPISASKAYEIGLINSVVEQSDLRSVVLSYCEKISSKSSRVVKIGKQAFYRQADFPLSEAYEFATRVMVDNMLDSNAEEGIDAFLSRRDAQWKDS